MCIVLCVWGEHKSETRVGKNEEEFFNEFNARLNAKQQKIERLGQGHVYYVLTISSWHSQQYIS